MAVTREEIVEALKAMPALELSELVKELEEVFGVSAAAPVMVAGGAAAGAAAPAADEKDEFDVELTSFGDKKIDVIKVIRELTSLGLKDAKELVEKAPVVIPGFEGVAKDKADEVKEKLEATGATITLK